MNRKNTIECICAKCGKTFIFRCKSTELIPSYCPLCHSERKREEERRQAEERQKEENEKWEIQHARECKQFERKLKHVSLITLDDVVPEKGRTLYIIGNGFDLMHGVNSSYKSFRDYLEKRGTLLWALEHYLKADDIWANFEEALGHFNMNAMAGQFNVGQMLDINGVFDEDAGAAEYYMAAEMAAYPIMEVARELPGRFREWVDRLEIGTEDRPLKNLFSDERVLCFNYTEFVEELYGVSENHVCYIHGCRKKRKGCPRQKLILGHRPGANDTEYTLIEGVKKKNSYRKQMIDLAQEEVVRNILQSDEELTKDCASIIAANQNFFDSLKNVATVIVIGHSLSPVDWDYFRQVADNIPKAHWYFGCHGIHDLENMEQLVGELGIKSQTSVFRTDKISVAMKKSAEKPKEKSVNILTKMKSTMSKDGKWQIEWNGNRMVMLRADTREEILERIFPVAIRYCVFSPDSALLFVIVSGMDAGIPFFRLAAAGWEYIDEMESIPHQNLINRRLRHVYLAGATLTFVYNSRIRIYSLETGELIKNQGKMGAKDMEFEGMEIGGMFKK